MDRVQTATREDLSFPSHDGRTPIHAVAWWPKDPQLREHPRGVVQIVHGMAEYVGRYDEFARMLCGHGYVVCGEDHVGHGGSASAAKRGCLPAKGGKDVLVEDVHTLRGIMSERVGAGVPYFMFGHSLGSYITRVYITRHASGLAGAIICGTGHVDGATSLAGNAVARLVAGLRGEDHKSRLLHNLGVGGYAKATRDEGENAWLSHRAGNVAAYDADPLCGFMFSAGGYATVTSLTAEACSPACAAAIPHGLPLLFIAGAEDPVGSYGEGVRKAASMAEEAGVTDVTCTIYAGMRHEILNEDGRDAVMEDVFGWLEDHLPKEA